MNRQKILIAACVLASVSVGANVWWLMGKKERDAAAQGQAAAPGLPTASNFDFTDTAFEDGTWKLDVEKPRVPKMNEKGEPVGPGFEAVPPEASGKTEKPVYGGSGLGDDSWKLGDGKEKEERPTIGPPKSSVPPAPALPQEKSASSRAVFPRSDLDGTGFTDSSLRLTDVSEAEPSVPWDVPFSFEDFTHRCPVTWEMESYMGDYGSGLFRYYFPGRKSLTGFYEVSPGLRDSLLDTANRAPLFERRFPGAAHSLRGWNDR